MKKIIVSFLTLALSVSMFAIDYTSKATVAMSDGTYFPTLTLGESSDAEFANNALVNGYYATVQDLNSTPLAVYAYYDKTEYESLVMNSLVNVPMGIKTGNATSYTLYFTGIEGDFSLYDKKLGQEIDCSAPYPFTIENTEKNSVLNNRFIIKYVASICFSNDVLDVIGYAGKTLKVEKEDGTPVVAEHALASDAEHFNLAQPSRTRLVVTLAGKVYQIDASVVPDPVVP